MFEGMTKTQLETELAFLEQDLDHLTERMAEVHDQIMEVTGLLTPTKTRARTTRKTTTKTTRGKNRTTRTR